MQGADRRTEARRIAAEFAALDRGLGWVHAGDGVDGFALLAALDGRIADAAMLIGFSEAYFTDGKTMARDAICEAAHARASARVSGGLTQSELAELRARGAHLNIDEAAALALESRTHAAT